MENSLETILNSQIDFRLSDIYVTMVAVVTGVSKLNECRIDVQPIVNKKYIDGEILEYPEILSVPVQFPSSSTSALTFPINQGDNVLLVFSQKGLDVFKSGATSAHDPIDMRSFDKRDAIAIPCVNPFSKSINDPVKRTLTHSVDDMVMTHNIGKATECEVRMKPTGKIELTSTLQVDVKAPITNITSTISSTVSAPVVAVTAITSATITSPSVFITSAAVAITGASFTWNGHTVLVA
jgi:hypothetical protein